PLRTRRCNSSRSSAVSFRTYFLGTITLPDIPVRSGQGGDFTRKSRSDALLVRHRLGVLTLLVALPGAVACAQVGEAPPRPIFADNEPVIPHEGLAKVALPNTTIDSVELNDSDGSCRVRATVTHPPTGCRVRVFVALPTKGWNGRFQGT